MTLELQCLSAGYGGIDVIHDIDLTVRPREIVTLIGPMAPASRHFSRPFQG